MVNAREKVVTNAAKNVIFPESARPKARERAGARAWARRVTKYSAMGIVKRKNSNPKGNGKGPAKGCWTCGAAHYASQCAAGGPGPGTRRLSEWWPESAEPEVIKRLSVLRTVETAPTEVSNSFQTFAELEELPEDSEELVESFKTLKKR